MTFAPGSSSPSLAPAGGSKRTTACVIGAGAAGLAAGRALAARGIDFDWFERSTMVGGLWRIENPDAAAYESLHTNSSRQLTEYPSFPMPQDWPDYPSHRLMGRYFEAFAEHFGLLERITFATAVTSVDPIADGGWRVRTADGTERDYQHVVVANGHHSIPATPDFPGEFTGETMHSHDYRTPEVFRGKRVLVVGVGNSGMDIACDASRVAERVLLSTRHGVHVLPKYALGRPIDHWTTPLLNHVPFAVERRLFELVLRLAAGTPEQRGLPKPDHRLLDAHPTVSAELLDRVGHGDIAMKPNVERFAGTTAWFSDGTDAEVDLVVFATGYRIALPFLDPDLLDPVDNQLRLYQRIVAPQLPGLWFVGFIQTVGAGIALFEYQSEWVGDLIEGTCALPSQQEMADWLEQDRATLSKRYVRSARHTIQVDYWRYIAALQAERKRRAEPGLLQRLRSALPV